MEKTKINGKIAHVHGLKELVLLKCPYYPKWTTDSVSLFISRSRSRSRSRYNRILFNLKKEGNPAFCDNIDECGESNWERQILHGIIYMWN